MEAKKSVTKLIDEYTKENMIQTNFVKNTEIAAMIKKDRKAAKEAVGVLTKIFKSEKYQRCYLALQMLEVLSKQGSLEFHEYLAQEEFMSEFMKLFKILRGKGGLFSRFEGKAKKELREKMQDQGLYLLQLWADTFMMYQDTYPGFHKYYRELKVEAIQFPQRENHEETIMVNLPGISSPMFDFVRQAELKREEETPTKKVVASSEKENERKSRVSNPKKAVKDQPLVVHKDQIEMDPDVEIADINIKLLELEEKEDYVEDNKDLEEQVEQASYKKYEKEKFDNAIFELSKRNFELLFDMFQNVESYTDI